MDLPPHAVDKDDTALFSGYTFEFNDNNVWLIHLPDGSTLTGAWKVDSPATIGTLNLDNPTSPLNSILGDWNVIEQLDASLKFKGKLDTGTSALDKFPVLEFTKQ